MQKQLWASLHAQKILQFIKQEPCSIEAAYFQPLPVINVAGLTPAYWDVRMDRALRLRLPDLFPDLDEGLLHLHGVEAVQRVGHAQAGLMAAVLAGHGAQPVHAPGLIPEGYHDMVTVRSSCCCQAEQSRPRGCSCHRVAAGHQLGHQSAGKPGCVSPEDKYSFWESEGHRKSASSRQARQCGSTGHRPILRAMRLLQTVTEATYAPSCPSHLLAPVCSSLHCSLAGALTSLAQCCPPVAQLMEVRRQLLDGTKCVDDDVVDVVAPHHDVAPLRQALPGVGRPQTPRLQDVLQAPTPPCFNRFLACTMNAKHGSAVVTQPTQHCGQPLQFTL